MTRTLTAWPLILMIGGSCLFAGCGATGSIDGAAPNITYQLERIATGKKTNSLLFEYSTDASYQYRLTGDGFDSSVTMSEIHDLVDQVDFSYNVEGNYSVDLEIFQGNETPYLVETLSWAYSTKIPDAPIISFSEVATNDTSVTLLVAGNPDADISEIWVAGDLDAGHAAGTWENLSESGLHLVTTSADDGMKTMQAKVRNIYGNESEAVEVSILKKSTPPTNCRAEVDGTGSANTTVQMQLFATNDGPVFYSVYGDVANIADFKRFTSGELIPVKLSGGEGLKHFTVEIRDIANNYCDSIEHTMNVSGGYVEQQLQISGNPTTTNSTSVTLLLQYDHFPSQEPIEMKITGDVTGSNINGWIPYQETLGVTLMPNAGEKRIYAQFRDNTGTESFLVTTKVTYQP